jgi:N-acetyl-anhydromuramyl-L-alanine amidase AmpD
VIATEPLPVPNFAPTGRTSDEIFGVVVHCTAGFTVSGEIGAFLANGTSAHYTVDLDGTIFSHVDEASVAFHVLAFGSQPNFNREVNRPTWLPAFDGRFSAVNASTVGIELIGFPDTGAPETAFTDQQYLRLADLIADICQRQAIPVKLRPDHGNAATIIAHGDVQTDRSDPGPMYDWARLQALIEARMGAQPAPQQVTIDDLALANPNIGRQLSAWQKSRVVNGQDPFDYPGFRQFQLDIGAPDPGPTEFIGFLRPTIEDLQARNPNLPLQLDSWRQARLEAGDDPLDYLAFRQFQLDIGAPDPGLTEFGGFRAIANLGLQLGRRRAGPRVLRVPAPKRRSRADRRA